MLKWVVEDADSNNPYIKRHFSFLLYFKIQNFRMTISIKTIVSFVIIVQMTDLAVSKPSREEIIISNCKTIFKSRMHSRLFKACLKYLNMMSDYGDFDNYGIVCITNKTSKGWAKLFSRFRSHFLESSFNWNLSYFLRNLIKKCYIFKCYIF